MPANAQAFSRLRLLEAKYLPARRHFRPICPCRPIPPYIPALSQVLCPQLPLLPEMPALSQAFSRLRLLEAKYLPARRHFRPICPCRPIPPYIPALSQVLCPQLPLLPEMPALSQAFSRLRLLEAKYLPARRHFRPICPCRPIPPYIPALSQVLCPQRPLLPEMPALSQAFSRLRLLEAKCLPLRRLSLVHACCRRIACKRAGFLSSTPAGGEIPACAQAFSPYLPLPTNSAIYSCTFAGTLPPTAFITQNACTFAGFLSSLPAINKIPAAGFLSFTPAVDEMPANAQAFSRLRLLEAKYLPARRHFRPICPCRPIPPYIPALSQETLPATASITRNACTFAGFLSSLPAVDEIPAIAQAFSRSRLL
ncbi:hypothetical protein [Paenibacillus oenotherae]|uniref:hypothetical protein n=1 Tax=Paenibacillus oenotherae TaxID=1435645 RepID=UPI001C6261D4|nr:hypothetical protein [Paenibacillus oenotherae]